MNNGKMKGMTLALLMMMAAFAGCLGGDDADDAAELRDIAADIEAGSLNESRLMKLAGLLKD